ncbi:hypothetical protein NUM3379_29020 [Kineococcus sp. NUM-3379]
MSAAEGFQPRVIDLDGSRRAPLARRVPGASGQPAPGTLPPARPAVPGDVLAEVADALGTVDDTRG